MLSDAETEKASSRPKVAEAERLCHKVSSGRR